MSANDQVNLIHLDALGTPELVREITRAEATVASAVEAAEAQIARLVDQAVERLDAGGRLIYVGAGTSGRVAALDAAEIPVTFGVPVGRVVAVMAGGPATLVEPDECVEDDSQAGAQALTALAVSSSDLVVGVTASGRTPYVLGAIEQARRCGATTAALVNSLCSPLGELVDLSVEVLTGPEVIAGSTRMKAATAQKMVLGALTTAAMVRLGRTHGNLMIAAQTHNDKQRRRMHQTVAEAAGCAQAEAEQALARAGGDGRVAVVMLLTGLGPDAAEERLDRCGGHVRAASGSDRGHSRGRA